MLGGAALGATALTYYMTRRDPPIDPLYDFDNQSVEIDVIFEFFFNVNAKYRKSNDKSLLHFSNYGCDFGRNSFGESI